MRKEACSGNIADMAHVASEYCLSDCLIKHSANPDNLIGAVNTGILPSVDMHPNFRSLMPRKAYLIEPLCCFTSDLDTTVYFLGSKLELGAPRQAPVQLRQPEEHSSKITPALSKTRSATCKPVQTSSQITSASTHTSFFRLSSHLVRDGLNSGW